MRLCPVLLPCGAHIVPDDDAAYGTHYVLCHARAPHGLLSHWKNPPPLPEMETAHFAITTTLSMGKFVDGTLRWQAYC